MKATAAFGMMVLVLQPTDSTANTPRSDREPDPDFWKDCTGLELRCVQRDASLIACPSDVSFRRMVLSDGGAARWYASSRHGGGNATPQELYAYKNSVTLPIALDLYATWGVDEVNKCQVDAFVRCHLSPRPGLVGGEAEACRQWAAAYGSNDRNSKLGTCPSKNGGSVYRAVNGVGDCK